MVEQLLTVYMTMSLTQALHKPDVMGHVSNPITVEVEAGRSEIQGHLCLHSGLEVLGDICTMTMPRLKKPTKPRGEMIED